MPLDGISYQDEETLGLINARHYVELGWCQCSMIDGAGAFCISGAIRQATCGWNNNKIYQGALQRFASLLPKIGSNDFDCIRLWNDAKGRTKEEVLAKFDEAIDCLD